MSYLIKIILKKKEEEISTYTTSRKLVQFKIGSIIKDPFMLVQNKLVWIRSTLKLKFVGFHLNKPKPIVKNNTTLTNLYPI